MKKKYMKPTMHVFELQHRFQILAGSGDPIQPDAPWWDGEADANHFDGWDGEDDWEDE